MFIPVMMAKTIEPGARGSINATRTNLFTVGRLKPSVSLAQAKAELETLTAQLAKDYPVNVGRGIRLVDPACSFPISRILSSPSLECSRPWVRS